MLMRMRSEFHGVLAFTSNTIHRPKGFRADRRPPRDRPTRRWSSMYAEPHRRRADAENAIRRPNGSHAKLCGRFRVPKPERRGGCRRGVAEPRLATCNRRDAATLAMNEAARLPRPKPGRTSFRVKLGRR